MANAIVLPSIVPSHVQSAPPAHHIIITRLLGTGERCGKTALHVEATFHHLVAPDAARMLLNWRHLPCRTILSLSEPGLAPRPQGPPWLPLSHCNGI